MGIMHQILCNIQKKKGYKIEEICEALNMNPCENQKIWNVKEAAYWQLFKHIDNKAQRLCEQPMMSLKDELLSEVPGELLSNFRYRLSRDPT